MPTAIIPTTNTSATSGTQANNPNAELKKDDFLKLFVAQMQHQDPSQPMDNSQMMAQMASFSSLEQMSNLTAQNAQGNAVALIGRSVTYKDKLGAERTGTVEKVSTVKGAPSLTVDGIGVDPAMVTEVA